MCFSISNHFCNNSRRPKGNEIEVELKKARRYPLVVALILGCILLAIIVLFPIVWGTIISFKNRVDALSMPPNWIFKPVLTNYKAAFLDGPYGRTIINSFIIASISTFVTMILGIPASYAFSRLKFKYKRAAFLGILAIRMAPATVIALPLFVIFAKIHLIDTHIAIILVHSGVNLGLAIWIMRSFFNEVPVEIDEASLIDGDSRFKVMIKQVVPVCAPGILVTAAFTFINSWNEFFLALMLTGYSTRPFTVAVPGLITPHGTYWGQVTAISTIGLLPALVFAILIHRFLIKGLTAGSVWR